MFLGLINKTVNKMEHTLDELEHFLENVKRDVVIKPIDCKKLMRSAVTLHEEEIYSNHIALDVNIEQTIPFWSDGARLRMILDNLLTNAIQFRDANKPNQEITISINVALDHFTLSVSDNGIGIDPEDQSKIFELFHRGTSPSSGTGIGLYVVGQAIEKMGGRITVDSVPGRGSVFTVVVPNLYQEKPSQK